VDFILDWWQVIEGREREVLLLINPSGDLCFDFFIAGDERVVALEDFVLNEGINAVPLAPLFGVLNASLERIGQCAVVGQMALIEGIEQGINYGFHIGAVGWLCEP
tara:strand:+ start:507 stop:824 length:318 start_codon:yes stop_codon:yes gene_type:complete